eukprot:scaffold38273_cov70-Cyclotella_meneghiniana.AAC.7
MEISSIEITTGSATWHHTLGSRYSGNIVITTKSNSSLILNSTLNQHRKGPTIPTSPLSGRHSQRAMSTEALDQIKTGGTGHVPNDKGDNTACFIFENFNSLAPWKNLYKYHRLNQLIQHFDADFALEVELQVQWHECNCSLRLEKHLTPSRPKCIAYGFNEHENFGRCQYGGTCAASMGKLAQFVQSTGCDPHHLGRWSWLQVGSGSVSTRIVSAYLPCNSNASQWSKKQRRWTVYNQHRRCFQSIGDNRCPRSIFVKHLALQIRQWKAAHENILLFVDANSDVYDGILAKALSADDIDMREVCRDILGHKSPNSHHSGSSPITGIFATSGLACSHVLQSGHNYGIRDHRLFVLDVNLTSLAGKYKPVATKARWPTLTPSATTSSVIN